MLKPNVGSQVDIHLTSGIMIRGVVAKSTDTLVSMVDKSAIHSQNSILAFREIEIDPKEIVAIGHGREK